jgi:hypothetical protein
MKWPLIIHIKGPDIGERQWVTIGLFAFATLLLGMAARDSKLWEVEVFKVIVQAVVLTGMLNMVLAFHFASNKGSETARENTGAAFRAIEAAATGQPPSTGLNDAERPSGAPGDLIHTTEEPKP